MALLSQEPSDGEYVRRVRAGDQRAFDALVARHREGVLSISGGVLGDWDEAQDVAQEAFLEALAGLDGLQRAQSFGAWLITIARRCASRRLRAAADGPVYVGAAEALCGAVTGELRAAGMAG